MGVLTVWEEASHILPAQLFLPKIAPLPEERPPVIVFLHGGGDGPFHLMNARESRGVRT